MSLITVVLGALVCQRAAGAAESNAATLTAFVDAVWRDPPEVMDLRVNVRVLRLARTEQHIREQIAGTVVDSFNSSADAATRPTTGAELDARVDRLVREVMAGEGQPQYLFCRFRTDGDSRRVDTVRQTEPQWGETTAFDESRITGPRAVDGSLTEITINYEIKSCTADSTRKKPTVLDARYESMGSVEQTLQTLIRGSTGRPVTGSNRIVQDARRTKEFVTGAQTLIPTVVSDTLDGAPVLRFDFSLANLPEPVYTVYCDAAARPLLQIVRDKTGRTIRRVEQSGYQSDGFPRYWKESAMPATGGETFEERTVIGLDVSTPPPKDVFEYLVPEGFLGALVTADKIVYQLPDGRVQEQARGPVLPRLPRASSATSWHNVLLINFWILVLICAIVGFKAYRNRSARRGSRPADH